MSDKNKTLKTLFIEEYEKRLENEIREIDEEIEYDAVLEKLLEDLPFSEIPEDWKSVIENRYSIKKPTLRKRLKVRLKFMRKRMVNSRVAVFIIIAFTTLITLMNIYPTQSMAVVKKVMPWFSWGSKSIEIGAEDYWPDIPDGFVLTDTKENKNLSRRRYENPNGNYIEVSIYPDSYKITADNEDLDEGRETEINGKNAVILSKKNITTIYIYFESAIVKVESDLLSNETEEIAETIK